MRMALAAAFPLVLGACAGRPAINDQIQRSNVEVMEAYMAKYNNCVLDSAVIGIREAQERNAVAERSFASCNTEEHALYAFLAAHRFTYPQAHSLMTDQKLKLKQAIVAAPAAR